MANEVQKQHGGLTAALAARYDMDPKVFLDTIKKTVMPPSATNEDLVAFCMVCKEYDLNPITREIYAYPKRGGGIQPIVGVDGWAKIVCQHQDFDGIEFDYDIDDDGEPDSVTCRLYRKNTSRPIEVTEYFAECRRNTDPWNGMPRRMLRHKALMQCGRYAFGLTGITDADEAQDFCDVKVVESGPAENPMAKAVQDKLAEAHKKHPEPTAKELADAEKCKAEQLARLNESEVKEDQEEADNTPEPEEEPKKPTAYQRLSRAYDERPDLVDECLAEVKLECLPELDWTGLDEDGLKRLKRAAAKYAKKISE